MLFPPASCFRHDSATMDIATSDTGCSSLLRNFNGLVATLCFVVILVSSLEFIRRRFYRVFWVVHVIGATVACVFTVLHWQNVILYLLPSLVFYMVGWSTHAISLLLDLCKGPDGTTSTIRAIPGSSDIFELTIAMHANAAPPRAGVRVCTSLPHAVLTAVGSLFTG